ncbi:MAG TPA: alpha/beta hydrolase [Acidimicrobiia bacterium]|nr:alpha/beta hydrolase [Acidimicrobiia bacterium]
MNEWYRAEDGTRLAFWHEPCLRRPSILLVHGLASNARLWDAVAVHLNGSGRGTLQIDLRGHGVSDKPDSGYDFATMSSDLAGIILEMMRPPVIAVGQSFGGNLVMEMAVRSSELVSSIVCVDGGFIDLAQRFGNWEACVAALTPPPLDHLSAASLGEAAAELYAGWPPEAIAAQLANLEEADDGSIRRRLSVAHHLSLLRAMFEQEPLAVAERCQQPVLLIAADDDTPGKKDQVSAFAKRLPSGREVWMQGHHDLHAEQPGRVAAVIESALGEGFLR